jgi:hypothetical protein
MHYLKFSLNILEAIVKIANLSNSRRINKIYAAEQSSKKNIVLNCLNDCEMILL